MEKQKLKINMSEHEKPIYYFYLCTNKREDLKKYYEYLREVEEITKDTEKSKMQVLVNSIKETEDIPSLLGSCFRVNEYSDDSFRWYNFSKINNSHHLIKLKTFKLPDPDTLLEIINDTKLIYEDKNILVVNYNYSINT